MANPGMQLGAQCLDADYEPQAKQERALDVLLARIQSANDGLDRVITKLAELDNRLGGPQPCCEGVANKCAEPIGVLNQLKDAVTFLHSRVDSLNATTDGLKRL